MAKASLRERFAQRVENITPDQYSKLFVWVIIAMGVGALLMLWASY